VQDHKDEGFGDLLTQLPVHASDQAGETTVAVQQREEVKILARFDAFWLLI
jgi:hypothetical protein